MDRLLRAIFASFVPGGNLRVTTARGFTFTVGDGPDNRAALRFATAQGRVRRPPRSRTALRRSLHGRRHRRRAGLDRRCACHRARSTPRRRPAPGPVRSCWRSLARRSAIQSAPACAAQRGASLRSRRPAVRVVPRCRPPIQLRLFRDSGQTLDDAQLAKKRHLAAKLLLEDRPARARHRLRLGRLGALSRRTSAARGSPA